MATQKTSIFLVASATSNPITNPTKLGNDCDNHLLMLKGSGETVADALTDGLSVYNLDRGDFDEGKIHAWEFDPKTKNFTFIGQVNFSSVTITK